MQMTLALDEPRARRRDPQTSKDAAASAKGLQQHHQRTILATLTHYGPMGKDEIGRLTKLDGVQVCRRLGTMERVGLIRTTGDTVLSQAGRKERVWEACQ